VVRDRADVAGFTLIELTIALTLGALVMLFAHLIFAGVAEGARRLGEAREHLDRTANGRRWLGQTFESLLVGERDGPFVGDSNRVQFRTWQLAPRGWLVRERVSLGQHDTHLVAITSSGDTLTLADSVEDVQFDYLMVTDPLAVGADTRFLRGWNSPISGPIAIRLRIDHLDNSDGTPARSDTLLFVIGPRG
jgi:prepilin-type N-terminal cleavage/methylation domain-containing protein